MPETLGLVISAVSTAAWVIWIILWTHRDNMEDKRRKADWAAGERERNLRDHWS